MSVLKKNNVMVGGGGTRTIVFSHGYGCDQNMWRFVEPLFTSDYQTVLFDHVGCGKSDLSTYTKQRYASLEAYAEDTLAILRALNLRDVIFVGHSVSATIGILAAIEAPQLFAQLVLVGPSPCYINRDGYVGGTTEAQINELLAVLESNHLGWSSSMAPAIMGRPDRPELGEELAASFCRMRPDVAYEFAKATFLSDHREAFGKVTIPSLVLQCSEDVIAPIEVGKFVHRTLPNSTFVQLKATGHCPNLSAPEETVAAIQSYLQAA